MINEHQRFLGIQFSYKLNKPLYLIKMHDPHINSRAHSKVRDRSIEEVYVLAKTFVSDYENAER